MKNNLKNDLKKYNLDLDVLKEYIIKQLQIESLKENCNIYYLDIYSPFLEDLSKFEFFHKIFILHVNIKTIEKFKLKKDYISAFTKMNNLNLKYPKIRFEYQDSNDIDYFKTFKFNFNLIEKLIICRDCYDIGVEFKFKNLVFWKANNNYFFKILFSFENIENNLKELTLKNYSDYNEISISTFEKINNFKSLEYLEKYDYIFEDTFLLRIYNLKY